MDDAITNSRTTGTPPSGVPCSAWLGRIARELREARRRKRLAKEFAAWNRLAFWTDKEAALVEEQKEAKRRRRVELRAAKRRNVQAEERHL